MNNPSLNDVQNASDSAQAVRDQKIKPDTSGDGGSGGDLVKPKNNQDTQDTLRTLHENIDSEIQKRKEANESISALREKAVILGISKKAQSAVEAFMKLNESDQQYFDEAVSIYRSALGKPMQGSLELV
jgi:hypothetical protein